MSRDKHKSHNQITGTSSQKENEFPILKRKKRSKEKTYDKYINNLIQLNKASRVAQPESYFALM